MPIICWLWERLACRHSAPTWRGQQLKQFVETDIFIHTYFYVCHLFIQISLSCCYVVVLRVYKCRYTAITSYANDFLPTSQHVCLRHCPSAVRSHIPHFWDSKHQPGFFITVALRLYLLQYLMVFSINCTLLLPDVHCESDQRRAYKRLTAALLWMMELIARVDGIFCQSLGTVKEQRLYNVAGLFRLCVWKIDR